MLLVARRKGSGKEQGSAHVAAAWREGSGEEQGVGVFVAWPQLAPTSCVSHPSCMSRQAAMGCPARSCFIYRPSPPPGLQVGVDSTLDAFTTALREGGQEALEGVSETSL